MPKYCDDIKNETKAEFECRLKDPVWYGVRKLAFRITNTNVLPTEGYYLLSRLIYNEINKCSMKKTQNKEAPD